MKRRKTAGRTLCSGYFPHATAWGRPKPCRSSLELKLYKGVGTMQEGGARAPWNTLWGYSLIYPDRQPGRN